MTTADSMNQLARAILKVQTELGSVPKGLASAVHEIRTKEGKEEIMINVKWETPQEKQTARVIKGAKWAPVKLMLIENPGQWALIYESKPNRGAYLPTEFKSQQFERAYRKYGKITKLYVRYVGSN